MIDDIERVLAESGITDPESLEILRAKLGKQKSEPKDPEEALIDLVKESAKLGSEETMKFVKEQGWTAPPQVDEARLAELNARADELRKARPTQANMAERAKVRKEIAGIVDASGVTYKVNRQ